MWNIFIKLKIFHISLYIMFEFFTKMIEEFGGLGLAILVLGGLLYFLISRSDKKAEKSIADLSENISTTLANQNKDLLSTLTSSNNQMQANLINLIEKTMNLRDQNVVKLHNASMNHRMDISDKMQKMLFEMMNFYHARRCGVMEFHNSTSNLNNLSFLWYDLSYENMQRNVTPISGQVKNLQLSILSPVMSDLINNDGIVVYRSSEIKKLEQRSPVLYDHLKNKVNASNMIYAGLYGCDNNLIGVVFLEYNDFFKYPEDIIDLHDIKERASGISQLLEFKSMV